MENQISGRRYQHIYVVLNPVAGHSQTEDLRPAIEQHFRAAGLTYEIYETTGEENIAEITRNALKQGSDLVVAAGGDGTVSGVIDGLVHEEVPLGIIPVGTGNGLARAMGIPLEPEDAIRLLTGDHILFPLDAMQVEDHYFVLNVSAGISSRAMRETGPEEKRRLGILAYVQTILKDVVQVETRVFKMDLDGLTVQVEAAEVLVANGTVLLEPPLLFGSRDHYKDGQLEVNILTAKQTSEFVRLARDLLLDPQETKSDLHDFNVKKRILLDVVGEPLPVQADGELIGQTPVEIQLVPGALKVVVPEKEPV
jgi:diacylglycerol kinase (ATP)